MPQERQRDALRDELLSSSRKLRGRGGPLLLLVFAMRFVLSS